MVTLKCFSSFIPEPQAAQLLLQAREVREPAVRPGARQHHPLRRYRHARILLRLKTRLQRLRNESESVGF